MGEAMGENLPRLGGAEADPTDAEWERCGWLPEMDELFTAEGRARGSKSYRRWVLGMPSSLERGENFPFATGEAGTGAGAVCAERAQTGEETYCWLCGAPSLSYSKELAAVEQRHCQGFPSVTTEGTGPFSLW